MSVEKNHFSKRGKLVEPPRDGEYFFEVDEPSAEERFAAAISRASRRAVEAVHCSPVLSLFLAILVGVLLSSIAFQFPPFSS